MYKVGPGFSSGNLDLRKVPTSPLEELVIVCKNTVIFTESLLSFCLKLYYRLGWRQRCDSSEYNPHAPPEASLISSISLVTSLSSVTVINHALCEYTEEEPLKPSALLPLDLVCVLFPLPIFYPFLALNHSHGLLLIHESSYQVIKCGFLLRISVTGLLWMWHHTHWTFSILSSHGHITKVAPTMMANLDFQLGEIWITMETSLLACL